MIDLRHGDCIEVLDVLKDEGVKVDAVITSPPYNTAGSNGGLDRERYLTYEDNIPNDEFIEWQTNLFQKIDNVLNENGVILYNISYGGNNPDTMWLLIANIIQKTNFTTLDHITWKKTCAAPLYHSRTNLTRLCESVFVFCRKNETKTAITNKKYYGKVQYSDTLWVPKYEVVYNIIEAKNNDGGDHTKVHKATYSTDLVKKLLNIYVPEGMTVLDPFNGTGTTGVACKETGRNYVGIELDETYYNLSKDRLDKTQALEDKSSLDDFFA